MIRYKNGKELPVSVRSNTNPIREGRKMTRRQYYVALAVLAVTGIAGGGLSSWLFSGQTAYGGEGQSVSEQAAPAEARFHKISLTSTDGKVVGTLVGEEYGITMFDADGHKWMSLEGGGVNRLSLYDGHGEAGLVAYSHPLGSDISVSSISGNIVMGENLVGLGDQARALFGPGGKGIGIYDTEGRLQVALNPDCPY